MNTVVVANEEMARGSSSCERCRSLGTTHGKRSQFRARRFVNRISSLMLFRGRLVGDSESGGLAGIAAPIPSWRTKCKPTRGVPLLL